MDPKGLLNGNNNILKPKIWLILTAVIHTFVGMLSTYDPSNDNETMFLGIMLIIPVYMLYAAFMTEGQAQARLAAVFAGPIVVWFLVCAGMGLESPTPRRTSIGNCRLAYSTALVLGHDGPIGRHGLEHGRRCTRCGGLNMDWKNKVLNPKGWLMAFGIIFILLGTGTT